MSEKIYGESDKLPAAEVDDHAQEFEQGVPDEDEDDEQPEPGDEGEDE
jgi:hypothetical protein